jgi:hypothetical protein
MLRIALTPHDRLIDLRCGSGLWNHDTGADGRRRRRPVLRAQAIEQTDLCSATCRMPFPDGSSSKAGRRRVRNCRRTRSGLLRETARHGAGRCLVRLHASEERPGCAWAALSTTGRLAERRGLIGMTVERLRKSTTNPLTDAPRPKRTVNGRDPSSASTLPPLIGGFVENILMRMAEHAMASRARARQPAGASDNAAAVRDARTSAKARIARGGLVYGVLQALTTLMMLDVWLFGRIRSGPFFALLVKESARPSAG